MDLYSACRTPRPKPRLPPGFQAEGSADQGGYSQDQGDRPRPIAYSPLLVAVSLAVSVLLLVFILILTWQVH